MDETVDEVASCECKAAAGEESKGFGAGSAASLQIADHSCNVVVAYKRRRRGAQERFAQTVGGFTCSAGH